jgi:hypothetical protein
MSKTKTHRKPITARRQPKSAVRVVREVSRKRSPLASLFGALAIVASIGGAYYSLAPRVVIRTPTTLDLKDPFANQFLIENEGYFSVYNVSYECTGQTFQDSGSYVPGVSFDALGLVTLPSGPIRRLAPGESTPIGCLSATSVAPNAGTITRATASIDLKYEARWLPHSFVQPFRFETLSSPAGNLVWFPRPYDQAEDGQFTKFEK